MPQTASRALRPLLLLALLALPVAHALGLADALAAAPSRPDVVTKRIELLNAQNALIRVQGDPLALRMDRLQAEQAVELTRAELEQAYFEAVSEIAGAYTTVLQTREQAAIAEQGLALSRQSLEIAEVRRANGGATTLDVQDAQVGVENAQNGALAAGKGLSVAVNNLEGMIGRELVAADLEPVADEFLVPLPALDAALASIEDHPQLLQTRQGLELARVGVELLDPRYASEAQIESARTQLRTTEALIGEVRRGFDLQARNLLIGAENAAESYDLELESLANARERLDFQRDRLAAGLVARIQVDQAELELRQAELAALQARNALLTALLDLQSGALLPLGGPDAYHFDPDAGLAVGGPTETATGAEADDD